MFEVNCPRCAGRRLIFPSQVMGIDRDASGIVVHFECWCGTAGTWSAESSLVSWSVESAEPISAQPIAA